MPTQQTPLQRIEPTAVEALTRADIDMQIATAHQYPRTLGQCQKSAMAMATADQETADSCFYTIPRTDKDGKKKHITGPSVRLGEIIASTWTNLRVATRIIGESATHVTTQAVCHDLETNVAICKEVRRKITNKHGKRYTEDMVTMTAMAASSIALRNAIFAVVPKHYWLPIHNATLKMAAGDLKTLTARVQAMLGWFNKRGITDEEMLQLLGVKVLDNIGADELVAAKGLATALTDGTTTVDDLLESLKNDAPPTEEEIETQLRKEPDNDSASAEAGGAANEQSMDDRSADGDDDMRAVPGADASSLHDGETAGDCPSS